MGYALRRYRLLVWSWQLCRGISGNFRVEPVAILPWNQWQFLHGISGNFQMESVATFAWNTHCPASPAKTARPSSAQRMSGLWNLYGGRVNGLGRGVWGLRP